LANGRKITAFSESESTKTVRCGAGSGACQLIAEGEGCRLIVTGLAERAGLLGFVGKYAGIFNAEFGKAVAAIERLIAESDGPVLLPGWSAEDLAELAARQRLDDGSIPKGTPRRCALGSRPGR
jgi:hypothetical protein